MTTRHWYLAEMTSHYYADALALVLNDFFPNSSLHQAVGMDKSEFEHYMCEDWLAYVTKCPVPGLVAIDTSTHQLIGCLISSPFPSDYGHLDSLTAKRRSIALLLRELDARFLRSNQRFRQAVMVDIAVVSAHAGGQGIYQAMRKQFQQTAAQHGYQHVVGALSSAATQRVCVDKLNQQVVSEIRFADYREQEKRPFASISHPDSIQLVVGVLN